MSHETDISFLDIPQVLETIFPLAYLDFLSADRVVRPGGASLQFVEVETGIGIGCGFWSGSKGWPSVLYFHGNGETVSDYEWIAPLYLELGVNLFVADYRGYGASGGKPTITNLLRDAHPLFEGFKKMLEGAGHRASIFVMGRSLGSVPAIEIAYHHQDELKGLIIESGAANNFRRLWSYLDGKDQRVLLEDGFLNKDKMKSVRIPTLVIHGERDDIVPMSEGVELYESSGAEHKDALIVPGAGHNDLLAYARDTYFGKVREFVGKYA